MNLPDFDLGDGTPAPFALSVWIAAIRRLYDVLGSELAIELSAIGGEVKYEFGKDSESDYFDGGNVTPRHAWFSHNEQHWAVIYGTWSKRQLTQNFLSFLRLVDLPNGQKVGSVWYEMAGLMLAEFQLSPLYTSGKPVNIAGHSLGAAAGWIFAVLLRYLQPTREINVLTFGMPRPVKGRYTGQQLTFHYDVQIAGDPVPRLPPFLPIDRLTGFYWRSPGIPFVFNQDGTRGDDQFNLGDYTLDSTLVGTAYQLHSSDAYLQVINQWVRRQPAPPPTPVERALAAMDAVAGQVILGLRGDAQVLPPLEIPSGDIHAPPPPQPQPLTPPDSPPPDNPPYPYNPPPLGEPSNTAPTATSKKEKCFG